MEEQLANASKALDQLNALQTDLLSLQAQEAALKAATGQIEAALAAQGKTVDDIPAMVAGLDAMITMLTDPTQSAILTAMDSAALEGVLNASGMSLGMFGVDAVTWDAMTAEERGQLFQKTAEGYQTQKAGLESYSDYAASLKSLQVEKAGVEAAVTAAEAELKKAGVSYTDIEKAKLEAAAGFGAASAQIAAGQSALNPPSLPLIPERKIWIPPRNRLPPAGNPLRMQRSRLRTAGRNLINPWRILRYRRRRHFARQMRISCWISIRWRSLFTPRTSLCLRDIWMMPRTIPGC